MGDKKKLIIGKLTRPHGIKGEVRMHYYGNDPDGLKHLKSVQILFDNVCVKELEFERIRASKNVLILKFKGVSSLSDTEKLVGGLVSVAKDELDSPKEDEYYWDDLLGMRVYDEDSRLIGNIVNILETKSNDIYVVKSGVREVLLPAIKDVIKKVDVSGRVMYVHLLEGMRDAL